MITEPETFTTGYTVIKEYPVKIPLLIYEVCSYLAKQDTSNEFAIIVKSENTGKGYALKSDFVIPEQTVSAASVDFDNVKLLEYRKQGYNSVIHFHPMNLKTFSGTDDRYINTHFDVSVLFCDNQFTDAIVNLDVNGIRIQVKGSVMFDIPDFGIQMTNIKKSRSYPVAAGWGDYWKPHTKSTGSLVDYNFYEVQYLNEHNNDYKQNKQENKRKVKSWKLQSKKPSTEFTL
jgi:hypothetical protein